MAAQDPSYLVPPQLLPHLHLISNYNYPVSQNLNGDAALNYLLTAPRIVRQMKSMHWKYFSPPPHDGYVCLTWQPTARQGIRFASDGYIWADPEQTYHFEMRGFQLEVLVHRSGYRPSMDSISCHARHRYHIINKSPQIAEDFDPNLWIVHWGAADPQSRIPVQNVRIHPDVHRIMNERALIESKGPLQRKDFVLYDSSQWPTINFGGPMQHPMAPRGPQFFQPPGADDPRVKRPRVEPPPGAAAGRQRGQSAAIPFDIGIEDEEIAQLGDFLDHLTPREISALRFKQHHEWFEEIFSSVYSTAQILPGHLGLGLAGDLEDLTRGILEKPKVPTENPAESQAPVKPEAKLAVRLADPTPSYRKLEKEQMDELDKRITEYLEKGQAEIRAMKAEHAKKLQDPKRNTYRAAERKLKETPGLSNRTMAVNDIVDKVETELNVTFLPKKDFTCIEKGGLEEEKKIAPAPPPTNGANGDMNGVNGNSLFNGLDAMGGDNNGLGANDNSAAGLLDQFGSGSYGNTPRSDEPRISTPQISQGQSATGTPAAAAPATDTQQQDDFEMEEGETGLDNPPDDSGLDFLEGMDLDAPIGEGDGGDEADEDKPVGGEDDWVMVNDNDDNAANAQATTAAASAAVPTAQREEQPTVPLAEPPAAEAPVEAIEEDIPAHDEPEEAPEDTAATATADDDIFGDITADGDNFNDFGLDDTAGDELADYTGGDGGGDDLGLNLDNSTFDDAFQATDLDNNQEHAERDGEEGV